MYIITRLGPRKEMESTRVPERSISAVNGVVCLELKDYPDNQSQSGTSTSDTPSTVNDFRQLDISTRRPVFYLLKLVMLPPLGQWADVSSLE